MNEACQMKYWLKNHQPNHSGQSLCVAVHIVPCVTTLDMYCLLYTVCYVQSIIYHVLCTVCYVQSVIYHVLCTVCYVQSVMYCCTVLI